MKVGIICGAFKPLHVGHFNLIMRAAQECDAVKVFASLADRGSVTGTQMHRVWTEHVSKVLPENIELVFCSNPIKKAYEFLGTHDKGGSNDQFYIYSDPKDINKSFSNESLKRYLDRLYEHSQLAVVPVDREGASDVSGTQVRGYLDRRDMPSFVSCMPACIDAAAVWDILAGGA